MHSLLAYDTGVDYMNSVRKKSKWATVVCFKVLERRMVKSSQIGEQYILKIQD